MKKRLSFLSILVLLFSLLVCPYAHAAEAYKISLNVDFVSNLVFSTYDVDLYLNENEQAKLSHGEDYDGSFYAAEGKNTIYFYKHGTKGVKGKIDLNVTGNTTVSCRINCHYDEIDVDRINIKSEEPTTATTRGTPVESDPEPVPVAEAEPVTAVSGNISYSDIDFSLFTDEELELAAADIKAEQRARMHTKIVLSSTEETLLKGKSVKLTGEVIDIPEGLTASKLTWTTSDKAVATCEYGNVTGVGSGTAVITCTSALSDGTEITNECIVTVLVPVTGITVEPATLSLGLKEAGQIKYTVKPSGATDQRVTFDSQDPSVVIVSADGVVTPTGVGSTTVTVKALDGSNASATCKIKVTAKSEIGIPRDTGGDVIVTLTGMKESKGNSLAKPDSGYVFLLLDYTIENNSRSSTLVSYTNFEGYYDGYKLDVADTIWLCDNANYLDDLEPGRKIKGQVSIQVPSNWKELEIQYVPSIWNNEKAVFMLYKQSN